MNDYLRYVRLVKCDVGKNELFRIYNELREIRKSLSAMLGNELITNIIRDLTIVIKMLEKIIQDLEYFCEVANNE